MALNFHKGNVLYPIGEGRKIIAHICNDRGAWNAGFTGSLNKRWLQPKLAYQLMKCKRLGEVQFVAVEKNIKVANMICQGLDYKNGPPIRYNALRDALRLVAQKAIQAGAGVHLPRIGCGLAGGSWTKVEELVISELVERGIYVVVYNLH